MNTQSSASTTRSRQGGCCCTNKSNLKGETQESSHSTDNGYPPHRLQVQGATCGGCVRSIEQTLSAVAGVTEASMDLKTGVASVVGVVRTNDLIEALERSGFPAALINSDLQLHA